MFVREPEKGGTTKTCQTQIAVKVKNLGKMDWEQKWDDCVNNLEQKIDLIMENFMEKMMGAWREIKEQRDKMESFEVAVPEGGGETKEGENIKIIEYGNDDVEKSTTKNVWSAEERRLEAATPEAPNYYGIKFFFKYKEKNDWQQKRNYSRKDKRIHFQLVWQSFWLLRPTVEKRRIIWTNADHG